MVSPRPYGTIERCYRYPEKRFHTILAIQNGRISKQIVNIPSKALDSDFPPALAEAGLLNTFGPHAPQRRFQALIILLN